jgi:hypothetical protein
LVTLGGPHDSFRMRTRLNTIAWSEDWDLESAQPSLGWRRVLEFGFSHMAVISSIAPT